MAGVDPVKPDSRTGANFNRYSYANNNPYKYKDPDGRVVTYAFSNSATVGDGAAVLNHWLRSETLSGELHQLIGSDHAYTIEFNRGGEFRYDDANRTVHIDVTSGLQVESSGLIQSPALGGGGHELSHAAEHDRIGSDAFIKATTSPQESAINNGAIEIRVGTSPDEARATRVEGQAAGELGEPARQNYRDPTGPVRVCSPTSNKEC